MPQTTPRSLFILFIRTLCLVGLVNSGCGDDDRGGGSTTDAGPNGTDTGTTTGGDGSVTDAGPTGDASSSDSGGGGDSGGDSGATTDDPCERIFACSPAPVDLAMNVADTQEKCQDRLMAGSFPPGLATCVLGATDCTEIADCINCRMSFESEFCRDVACPFIVTECALVGDEGQCTIDCDNVTGGAAGCFPGYEITCWTEAANANNCEAAASCAQLAF